MSSTQASSGHRGKRPGKDPREDGSGRSKGTAPVPAAAAWRRWAEGRGWLVLLAPLLALVLALTLSYLWNEDFWWYLSSGQAVLATGGIPHTDPFLATQGPHTWVFHSWLWTVLVAALNRLGGLSAVVALHAAVAASLVILVYTARRIDRTGLGNALLALLVVLAAGPRLTGKAELASLLLLVAFLRICEREGPWTHRRTLSLLGLQLLWANLHGGYPLGVFVVLSYAAGCWLEARRRPEGGPSLGPPFWLPVALLVVSLLGPGGLRERLSPFGFVTGSTAVQPVGTSGQLLITEWRSPFAPGQGYGPWLWLLIAAAAAVGLLARRRRSLPRLLVVVGLALAAGAAIRHLALFAAATATLTIVNLGDAVREGSGERTRRRAGPIRIVAALMLAVAVAGSAWLLRSGRSGFEVGQSAGLPFTALPRGAAPAAAGFVLTDDPPGPLFNDFQLGGYLGYRLHSQRRVFIDSRVLDPQRVVAYTQLTSSPGAFGRVESRWRTAVLGNYSRTLRGPIGRTLEHSPGWKLAFLDPLATVWIRARQRFSPRVDLRPRCLEGRVPFTLAAGRLRARWTERVQAVFLHDWPSNYLVEYLADLGELGRTADVEKLASRALPSSPRPALLLRQRCAARAVLGRLREALADCDRASALAPDDADIARLRRTVRERASQR